ncbi:MAG: hypothetical protein ACKO2N_15295 [Tabrizicola sp.]
MSQIGHNGGPTMEAGASWRRHCWKAAREAILPVLPIEVVRLRVKRAAALGLDYRTYAGVRAASGHDVIAFLFSSNALAVTAMRPEMPGPASQKLVGVEAGRLGLAVAPLAVGAMAAANPCLDDVHPAPFALARWAEVRAGIRDALGQLPGAGVVLVGNHALEAEWCVAGKLAGYLPAERYFAGGESRR